MFRAGAFQRIQHPGDILIAGFPIPANHKDRVRLFCQGLLRAIGDFYRRFRIHVVENISLFIHRHGNHRGLGFLLGRRRRRQAHRKGIQLHHVHGADHEEYQKEKHDIYHGNDDDLRLLQGVEISFSSHHCPLFLTSAVTMACACSTAVRMMSMRCAK